MTLAEAIILHHRQVVDAARAGGDRRTRGRARRRAQPRRRGHDDHRRRAGSRPPTCTGAHARRVAASRPARSSRALFGCSPWGLAANQVACGLALTILGLGLSGLIGTGFVGLNRDASPHSPHSGSDRPAVHRPNPVRAGRAGLHLAGADCRRLAGSSTAAVPG